MWCRAVEQITFHEVTPAENGVSKVLGELTQELETEIFYTDGMQVRLTFPEYYEEAVENTPARIIDTHWHGSGYKYRQCFPETKLNLRLYDELFPYAVANEFGDTCMNLALNRQDEVAEKLSETCDGLSNELYTFHRMRDLYEK